MAGKIKLDGTQFLEKVNNEFKITNSELKLKSTGNTIVDSSGNAVVSESGGNVTLGNVRLPSTGGIKDSSGNNVFTESGGTVTLNNGTIGSDVVFPAGHYKKFAQYALFYVNGDGGTATSGSWQTYPLNTEIDNSDSLVTSFSSNQVTVSAGTYLFFLRGAFYLTNGSNLRLYNVTAATAVGNEFSLYVNINGTILGFVKATFTVSTTLKMEYHVETTNGGDGLGVDRGVNQQYGDLTIFQVS